jgi:hypothetical protein
MNQYSLQYAICHRLFHQYHLPLPFLSVTSAAAFSAIVITTATIYVASAIAAVMFHIMLTSEMLLTNYTGHMRRAESVESGGSIVHNVLHAGIFLLDANMKLVLPFRSLVTVQSTWVPTRSVLLQVTSLPTSISYSICLHPDMCN